MMNLSVEWLVIITFGMLLVSGFFSGSETGLMAVNRYRLHHLAQQGDPRAKRLVRMLERPDRLLTVILIGNTFANIAASAVITVLGSRLYGELGVVLGPILLTVVILIFAEIMPKTVASLYAEPASMAISRLMAFLLKVLYPIIWFTSQTANGLLRLFGIKVGKNSLKPLTRDELKGLLNHSSGGSISDGHLQMLQGVLDLDRMTVDHVMIPRNMIYAVNLAQPWQHVLQQLGQLKRMHVLCYRDEIDNLLGVIYLPKIINLLISGSLNKATFMRSLQAVRYVPEGTSLNIQMSHFKRDREHFSIIVDEYGDIKGMVTMDDILEEIVGHFMDAPNNPITTVRCLPDGAYLVAGSYAVRDLNRAMGWELPTDGPNTVSGLLMERLETIPDGQVSLRIGQYVLEVVDLHNQMITSVKVTVDKVDEPEEDEE